MTDHQPTDVWSALRRWTKAVTELVTDEPQQLIVRENGWFACPICKAQHWTPSELAVFDPKIKLRIADCQRLAVKDACNDLHGALLSEGLPIDAE